MQIRNSFLVIMIVSLFLFMLTACDPASMGCDSDDTGTQNTDDSADDSLRRRD